MDTFLELPLDRDLYKPRKFLGRDKPPLRVLITEAGTRTAHHLMYKICTGEVFGHDQPVILHLVNARGCINHRATLLDLEECGFPVLADSVVSSEPEKSYKNVDIVILVALLEELSGHNVYNSFLCQLNKIRNVARNAVMYAKPEVKFVISSPSTKGGIILLSCLKQFEPHLNVKHVTSVVCLDETIAKALTAAQFKTTTDKIKNVVIWGGTCPDIKNATVFMYPPEDMAYLRKVEMPVMQVLQNEKWVYSDLIPRIYKRVLDSDLARYGIAIASATAKHLKVLFKGSGRHNEIVSMGVIVPHTAPYGITKDIAFALPVVTKNGEVTIRQGVECSTTTHLMNLRTMFNFMNDPSIRGVRKVIKFIKDYEESTKKEFLWNQHTYLVEKYLLNNNMRYIISPRHNESMNVETIEKEVGSKKSITWEEGNLIEKSGNKNVKSILRFNLERQDSA